MAERIRRTQKEILRDKIAKIDGEVEKHTAALKRLKTERTRLEKELGELEVSQVAEILRSNSITAEELQALVAGHMAQRA